MFGDPVSVRSIKILERKKLQNINKGQGSEDLAEYMCGGQNSSRIVVPWCMYIYNFMRLPTIKILKLHKFARSFYLHLKLYTL